MQKCIATIRILAYESPTDSVDEYIRVVECTTIRCFEDFVKGVNQIFGDAYLGRPNNNDINCLLQIGEVLDFQVCWVLLIACNENGKFVQLHGKTNIIEMIIVNPH